MRESEVENYARRRIKELGFQMRKVQWIGRRGAPDDRILGYAWVEFKRPGEVPEPHQEREIERMREAGERVCVIDTKAGVDVLCKDLMAWRNTWS